NSTLGGGSMTATIVTTGGGTATNSGTFILSSVGSNNTDFVNFSGTPTLVNAGTITINAGPSADGGRTINGSLLNQPGATVNVNASTTLANNSTYVNGGTINIAAGKALSLPSSGRTFTQNSGSLNITGSFLLSGG